jgi:hypothetical protein
MNGPNGSKFDKMQRSEQLRKNGDVLRVLRKHAPDIAEKVEALDATFSEVLAKLERIEAAEAVLRASPSRIAAPPREPNGDDILASMRSMTPAAREALMVKLKQ